MRDMLDLGCRGAKAALSAAALEELRRRCALVASDVDLGPAGRADFVGFMPAAAVPMPAALERGEFTFVKVRCCMRDVQDGGALAFEGDSNWLVCTEVLADQLIEAKRVPAGCALRTPDAGGGLAERRLAGCGLYTWSGNRSLGALELLWRMMYRSAETWRTGPAVLAENDAALVLLSRGIAGRVLRNDALGLDVVGGRKAR